MKNKLLLALFIFIFTTTVYAADVPGDVPDTNVYYEYLQDLSDRGVDLTQSFPDGTFRGRTMTTKYDITYLMWSLRKGMVVSGTPKIDVSDLKGEIEWLRNEVKIVKAITQEEEDFNFGGSVDLNSFTGNLLAYDRSSNGIHGPEAWYRLRYSMKKKMGKDANIRIGLDSMDGGFNSPTTRTFPVKMLEMEGNFSTDMGFENPIRIKVLSGPGTVYHINTGEVSPSEDHRVFSRPKNSIFVSTKVGELDYTGGFVSRAVAGDGFVGTSEINFAVARNMGDSPLFGTVEANWTSRYLFRDFMNPTILTDDLMTELNFNLKQSDNVWQKVSLWASTAHISSAQYFLGLEFNFLNMNDSGTELKLNFYSAGVDFRRAFDSLEFTPQNIFDKKIFDGTNDIALKIRQPLNEQVKLVSKTDIVSDHLWKLGGDVPGTSFTQELGFEYNASTDLVFNMFYRYYHVPSSIAQFSVVVPEYSDLLGIGISYKL